MTARASPSRSRRDEHGSATLPAIALLGVLLLVGAALGVVAAAFVDHRRAQAAADLGALAGAVALQRGEDGCGRAATVAAANGAELLECDVAGEEVAIEVRVRGPDLLGWQGDLVGSARAGPAAVG